MTVAVKMFDNGLSMVYGGAKGCYVKLDMSRGHEEHDMVTWSSIGALRRATGSSAV